MAAPAFLEPLSRGASLTEEQAYSAIAEMLSEGWSEPEIASFLSLLAAKGETADELVGAARSLLDRAVVIARPTEPMLDNCGTGGDRSSSFNVSTATAFAIAACGVKVAKHGNRNLTSRSGSADVLQELGVNLDAPPECIGRSLAECGLAFFFAPRWHPAVAKVQGVRRALKFRTIFNLVGPLANPLRPSLRFVGVGADDWQGPLPSRMAQALQRLRVESALVAVGADGLDEITLGAATRVLRVTQTSIRDEIWTPEDFGLPRCSRDRLQVGSPAESAAVIRQVLANQPGPALDVVLANAAAALVVAGAAGDLREGVETARRSIAAGNAAAVLAALVRCTHS